MDYRNTLACGFVILSISVLLHTANASLPVGMQHGQFPYETFSECDVAGATVSWSRCSLPSQLSTSTVSLLTVPSDRIFVVTGAAVHYQGDCSFQVNGTPIVSSRAFLNSGGYSNARQSPFLSGAAHYVISAGETLDVYFYDAPGCQFYLEGYYAHL